MYPRGIVVLCFNFDLVLGKFISLDFFIDPLINHLITYCLTSLSILQLLEICLIDFLKFYLHCGQLRYKI